MPTASSIKIRDCYCCSARVTNSFVLKRLLTFLKQYITCNQEGSVLSSSKRGT